MTRVWSHRPAPLHLAIFFAAYMLGCGVAQALAIVPGTGISIWPPSGLFLATLAFAARPSWPWWVLAGLLAELTANVLWFHNPLPVAILIFTGNALESMTGAWLVTRFGRPARLESLQEVIGLTVLGAGIAPVVSATVGSMTLAGFGMQPFATAWALFWLGNASGVLIIAPLALVLFQDWRDGAGLPKARWFEASAVGLVFLGVAGFSLSDYFAFAYLIMPPLLWAAVRFEFRGATVSLALLALIAVMFAISGDSQFASDPGSQGVKQIMLYLFLAVSAFSALVVAAISRQNHLALRALGQREQELLQLVDMLPVYIRRLTPQGEPIFFNKRLTDFIGMKLEDIKASGPGRLEPAVENYVHPDEATAVVSAIRHAVATGEAYSMKYRMRGCEGVYRWIETRTEPLRNDDGTIAQWYSVSIDIDDQVRLFQELEEREGRIRRLVDSDVIGIIFWDLDGRILEANDAFLRMVQYEREDLQTGPGWLDMTPPEWQDVHARDEAAELRATGKMQAREKEFFRKDGSRVPVLIGAVCFAGQSDQGVAYILDLTERKRAEAERLGAEEALRRSQLQLQQMVDTVPVQIWCVTPGGDPAYINRTMVDYIGLKLDDFDAEGGLPSAIETIVHPDDRSMLRGALQHSFETGEPFALKFRNRRWDGVYRWTEGRAEPLRDENGCIVRWYGANVDIDDFVTSQDALKERERFVWQVVETLPAMVDCAAPDGEPIYRNKQLREFLGYDLEALDGTGKSRLAGTLDAGVHPDELEGVKTAYAHSLSTGEPYARRHRLRRSDGEYRWVETRASPMYNMEGATVQWNVICLDIDGEVLAQEKLRQAQEHLSRASQAASLSELSASIAHEVNQPLAAIVANSHACHRWLADTPPNLARAKITAERIIRDANSAADVVSRIRALFKRSPEARGPVELSNLVAEGLGLMADEAMRLRVRFVTDIESNLPVVLIDRVQILQVLVNLMRNGLEAMESTSEARVLRLRLRLAGDVIRTEVSDRGPGIAFPEKVFEPFFTTKEHGMGMGLAVCRSIVEAHHGRLWAERNEPHGATFIFTLPVETKDAP
jgi:PAS domain S-box-containing protein